MILLHDIYVERHSVRTLTFHDAWRFLCPNMVVKNINSAAFPSCTSPSPVARAT